MRERFVSTIDIRGQDLEAVRALAALYTNQQEFFKALESTYISQLISEVRIRVRARNVDGALTFRELSEGEQQLLMVLGLLRFTREDESLFLLDEPDTHLNPAWSIQYFDFLKKIAGTQENSHIIMATHDPLVIAGLEKSQVQILQRDEETGKIHAETPEQDPKGMGVSGLLRSELYGLRSALDLPTLEKIDERDSIRAKQKELQKQGKDLPEEDRLKLIQLSDELSELGFSRDFRDPIEQQFADAMTRRRPKKEQIVLTPQELKEQEKVADEILEEILVEEQK